MATKKWQTSETTELFEAILQLRGIHQAKNFFRDLLTEKELLEFGRRWRVAQLLSEGVSYAEIEKQTHMSSTTIARIARWLKKGTGGYQSLLKK